ncbi:MAG: molybdopterin molybdotransferase MoeA [bacterium]|nr:molybdopterin molybdotransferase MoeA [bacterium]
MISYKNALDILLNQKPFSSVTLPVREARGHVATQDISSEVFVPSFANSAMDGFAVRSVDSLKASAHNPIELKVSGGTSAGDAPALGMSGAWEIMTGAPIPQGYDAVVKVEDVEIIKENADGRPEKIALRAPVPIKDNIRNAGEDFTPGAPIIDVGTVITPFHVMALSAVGQKTISVASQPRITIFGTGKEIIDDMDAPLLPGQIRNSNAPYLMSALADFPVTARYGGTIPDVPELFEENVQKAFLDSDILLSTGAVSMGRHDFIPDSLHKMGAEILFHKVSMRPGKPILYAKFPNGVHYLGLPGNPVSSAVGFRFFVVPLLHKLLGLSFEQPIKIGLSSISPKKLGFRFFRKAHISVTTEGKLRFKILQGQESFKIHSLLKANCWAVLSEESDGSKIGEMVEIYPLTPGKWSL